MKDMEPIREGHPAAAGRARSRGRAKAMSVERVANGTSLIDVLDRVVDKGIVTSISPAQIGRFLKERGIATAPKSVLGTSQH